MTQRRRTWTRLGRSESPVSAVALAPEIAIVKDLLAETANVTDPVNASAPAADPNLQTEIVVKKTKIETETEAAKTEKETGTDGTKTAPKNQGALLLNPRI